MTTQERLIVLFALALLTLVNWQYFPGHTWLQSDTQIYVPIFERLEDPTALPNDIVATRPHTSWTIYDEVTLGLRAATGLGFEEVLFAQQILFRFLGLLGVFLLAHSCGLRTAGALFVAATFGLGAVINGPAVLTFEYEPVPRGFAVMLLMAAIGFGSKERWNVAEVLAGVATLYHPPTTAPFWACTLLWWLVRRDAYERLRLLAWALGAAVVLLISAQMQEGTTETQKLFGRVDQHLETLQRLRGAYNWVGMWPASWFWQYPFLFAVVVGAWWRLKATLSPKVKWFSLALPLFGLAMMPVSYLLLDVGKWILVPQYQPARAVLFVTAFAVILASVAGWRAASCKRWWEAAGWMFIVYAVPVNGRVLELFYGVGDSLILKRLLIVLALAGAASVLAWLVQTRAPAAVVIAMALPLILLPTLAQVRNYPNLHEPDLYELAAWARANTAKDAVFQFADAGHSLAPGIFRAEAIRTLYVDWKSGGQVNMLRKFAVEWGDRWKAVKQAEPPIMMLEQYAALGIDYVVVSPSHVPVGVEPVWQSERWAVLAAK